MGCHFLLHCMKVKSESEVAQSCPTPSDPMDSRFSRQVGCFWVAFRQMISCARAQPSSLLHCISGGQAWAFRLQPQRRLRPPHHPSLCRVLFLFSDSALESASLASGRGCNLTHRLFALKASVDVQRSTGSPSVTVLPVCEASPASAGVSAALLVDADRGPWLSVSLSPSTFPPHNDSHQARMFRVPFGSRQDCVSETLGRKQ